MFGSKQTQSSFVVDTSVLAEVVTAGSEGGAVVGELSSWSLIFSWVTAVRRWRQAGGDAAATD
jgi:hypothetical protein